MNRILRFSTVFILAFLTTGMFIHLVRASNQAYVSAYSDSKLWSGKELTNRTTLPKATLLVITQQDELNNDGDCSLQEAIRATNTNLPVDTCTVGDKVIYLPLIVKSPSAPPPTNPNKIVFTSDRDGNEELYTMDQDGSNVLRLTQSQGRDYAAKWSPDWTKIAFTSERDGNGEIYTMNADGSDVVRLTNNAANDTQPDWSPDGTQIVFASDREGDFGIYIMASDGSGVSRIGSFWGLTPLWSPSGDKIAFTGASAVYVVNIDGTGLNNITPIGWEDSCPGWSPDGNLIAFNGYDRGKDVFVVSSNGGGITRLTYNNWYSNGCPSWRADGEILVFDQMVSSYIWEIFTVDYHTKATKRLTYNSFEDAMADWTP